MKLFLARKILPVTAPPIDNGAICIKNGRILDIGPRSRLLKAYGQAERIDLGGLLVMPGLVNAHAHLELSHLHGMITGHSGFFDWIERLIELRRSFGTKNLEKAAKNTVKSAIVTGTTCIGDISATELAVPAILKSGMRAVVFLELIGLDASAADAAYGRLVKRLKSVDSLSRRLTAGISPHSTYSVSGRLYDILSDNYSGNMKRMSVHLSESPDEIKHIRGMRSGVDSYHDKLGWSRHAKNKARSPLELLIDKGFGPGLLAVHAVHVSARDIGLMVKQGVSVAYCPRSNHFLGVGSAPVARMITKGVNVALGTDSLASNISIDLWDEMRFASIVSKLSCETLIRMSTINGALALGLGSVTGSLEPGKAADMIAVDAKSALSQKDPYTPLVYDTRPCDIKLCMVEGRVIHKAKGSDA